MNRRLFAATLVALVLGTMFGLWLGPEAAVLGQLGKFVVRVLKATAIPMLFLAILGSMVTSQLSGRGVKHLGIVAACNSILALVIALVINHLVKPGQYLKLGTLSSAAMPANLQKPLNWGDALSSLFPESFLAPFVEGSTTGVILIAVVLGLALRRVSSTEASEEVLSRGMVAKAVQTLLLAHVKVMEWLVFLVPLGVFGAVAQAIGKHGIAYVYSLGIYLAVCLGGLAVQILVVYQGWVLAHPKLTLREFWSAAKAPVLYAFGVNSSLATMPMTLGALERLDISEEAARLSACIGTNFNNDGILLYEVAAGMMLAQAMGIDMGLKEQLLLSGVAVLATIGVSGFPEAGLIALTLVLTTFGIPTEAILSLLAVDWIVGRCRSGTNVLGDMAVAVAIDRRLGAARLVPRHAQ